jgi:hypothetical protein
MDYAAILQSGTGAIIGFTLAQAVNLAKLGIDWLRRPILRIDNSDNCCILSDFVEVGSGELCQREMYAFSVTNRGKRIATHVRFQLIKLEYRGKTSVKREDDPQQFHVMVDYAASLPIYDHAFNERVEETTLVPGATALIKIAEWRDDYDVIWPAIHPMPQYFEESCQSAESYRFTVVVFADGADVAKRSLIIRRNGTIEPN